MTVVKTVTTAVVWENYARIFIVNFESIKYWIFCANRALQITMFSVDFGSIEKLHCDRGAKDYALKDFSHIRWCKLLPRMP